MDLVFEVELESAGVDQLSMPCSMAPGKAELRVKDYGHAVLSIATSDPCGRAIVVGAQLETHHLKQLRDICKKLLDEPS